MRLRAARPRHKASADFDFGPEREAWEAVFDDATMSRLNRALAKLPKSVRQDVRRQRISHQVHRRREDAVEVREVEPRRGI